MNCPDQITLAIESAICGGSISLLRDHREIASWIGVSNMSKAEDLLFNIDAMLTANNIRRQEIDLIAVSAGPGSFTGIRIGLATALGLKTGLGIKMSSESALKAMAFSGSDRANLIAAIPMGRNAVCFQSLQKQEREVVAVDEPRTLAEDAFASLVGGEKDTTFVLHAALYEKIGSSSNVTNVGANIARAIGAICRDSVGVVTEPLFISKSF